MKIRSGFVSNSSSTSFCIFGLNFHNDGKSAVEMADKIKEFIPSVIICWTESGDTLVGIGNRDESFDLEEWDGSQPPTEEEVNQFKKVLVDLGEDIKKATYFSEFWYDG